jgi:hypothetical protein
VIEKRQVVEHYRQVHASLESLAVTIKEFTS